MSDDNQNADGSFNDNELQDIMNEIENLEKDFIEEQSSTEIEATSEVEELKAEAIDSSENESQSESDDLQSTIDAEIEELNAITEVTQVDESEEIEQTDNVISIMQEPATQIASTYSGSPVELTCHGDMNFNMNFSLGESTANVKVDKQTGLSVELDGVSFTVNEESGCSISLPGGIKFTVPLTSASSTANKKAG
jgi:hypothetical protein